MSNPIRQLFLLSEPNVAGRGHPARLTHPVSRHRFFSAYSGYSVVIESIKNPKCSWGLHPRQNPALCDISLNEKVG